MKMSGQETFKIFCGNLSSVTIDDDLHLLFSQCGSVVEAVVMTGKNYGFVHMSNEQEGLEALKLHGHMLNGERLSVQRSINTRRPSIPTKHVPHIHHNLVGKGISSLDDFETYPEPLNPIDSNILYSEKVAKPPVVRPPSSSSPANSLGYSSILNPASSSTLSESSSGRPSPLHASSPQTPEHLSKAKTFENEYTSQIDDNNMLQDNSLCGVCREPYDTLVRVPKILSCNHTFCYKCLSTISKGLVIKCPHGCPYITNLLESGISGLTTNQTVPIQSDSFFGQVLQPLENKESVLSEVCCQCLCMPPTQFCLHQRHNLLPEADANMFLKNKLKKHIDFSLQQLRTLMSIRDSLRERMQSTMHSLAKFSEELKMKIEGEDLEEAMQQSLLSDLNQVSETLLDVNSIHDLLSTCTKIQNYTQNITSQYNQCAAKVTINELIDSIVLKLKLPVNGSLKQLGFSQEEAFSMASTLEENASKGNFANVLLIYLLCDLLTTRHNPNPIGALHSYFSPSPHSFGNLPNPLVSVNEAPIQNNVDSQILDQSNAFDIDEVRRTTEAIESSGILNGNLCYPPPNGDASSPPIVTSALSLGLSNVSLIGADSHLNGILENGEEYEKEEEEEKPSSYLDALKKPAKSIVKPPVVSPKAAAAIPASVKPVKFPHCWMVISIDGIPAGRIVFQLRPDKAPKMCDNFIGLCTGISGYSYKGSHFFKSGDGFLVGGDVENDDGTGGYSVYNKQKFEADLCPLKDDVGMVRFKGIGTNDSGRGMVGSQFMIWYTEREFKKFSYSLVFGRVVDGLDIVQRAANHNLSKTFVKVEECGAI